MGDPGWLLGCQLGAGHTPQDHSFYPTKSQPDRPQLTPIRDGFWLGSWAFTKSHSFLKQPDVSYVLCVNEPLSSDWGGRGTALEIVRLGIPRLGTWRKRKQGFDENTIWPPMSLRIGLLRSSALQTDGRIKPVILQCRTPQETNPTGHWGPHYFFI